MSNSDNYAELERLATHYNLHGPTRILKVKELAEWRSSHCVCPVLERRVTKPELDHDHQSGRVRATLQGEANAMVGKCENIYRGFLSGKTELSLPDVLRNIADYLEADYRSQPLHPAHRKALRGRFMRLKAEQQARLLGMVGVDTGTNAKSRAEAYVSTILTNAG